MTPEIITPDTEPIRFQCRHIFTDGRRCGSPAIRGLEGPASFCYYHHNSRRPIQDAPTRRRRQSRFAFPNPADFSDRSGIQLAIGEVLRRIASNDIDPRRAGLLLYGLQIASLNLPKPNPAEPPAEIVSEVTHDPEHGLLAPPAELGANQPKGSMQRLLEELGWEDDEPEISRRPAAAVDLQASADSKAYTESTTPAQTVPPASPSKSHRPTNSFEPKEAPKEARIDVLKGRSHELCSIPHRNAVSPGRTRTAGSAPAQPGPAAAPDLCRRRSGRPR